MDVLYARDMQKNLRLELRNLDRSKNDKSYEATEEKLNLLQPLTDGLTSCFLHPSSL